MFFSHGVLKAGSPQKMRLSRAGQREQAVVGCSGGAPKPPRQTCPLLLQPPTTEPSGHRQGRKLFGGGRAACPIVAAWNSTW